MGIFFEMDEAPIGFASHRVLYNKFGEIESTYIESVNKALCHIIDKKKSET